MKWFNNFLTYKNTFVILLFVMYVDFLGYLVMNNMFGYFTNEPFYSPISISLSLFYVFTILLITILIYLLSVLICLFSSIISNKYPIFTMLVIVGIVLYPFWYYMDSIVVYSNEMLNSAIDEDGLLIYGNVLKSFMSTPTIIYTVSIGMFLIAAKAHVDLNHISEE